MWILATRDLAAFSVFFVVALGAGSGTLLRSPQLGLRAVTKCAGAVAIAGALGATAGLFTGHLAHFGGVMLAWIVLALVVPACGATLLLRARRVPTTRPAKIVAWCGLALLAPAGWAALVEPFRLQVERARVSMPPARSGTDPVRVGVLADLQAVVVRDHERAAVALLMAQEPDIILLPGDVYQGDAELLPERVGPFRELLSTLRAPGGVYLVSGDCDPRRDDLLSLIAGTGVQLLEHQVVRTTVGDRAVSILGLANGRAADRELQAFAGASDADIRIVVVHHPRVVLRNPPGGRIDLYVAGHTHGGQIVVPFFGPPVTLSPLPRRVAAGGLHELAGTRLYVSRGVGMERALAPRVRFFCPPEVSLLTLE